MKKEIFNIILIVLSVIFVGLQYVYSQIKLKTGVYNMPIRYAEYVIVALLMITTLVYVRKESKELFKKLLIIFAVLAVLFVIFLLKGVI